MARWGSGRSPRQGMGSGFSGEVSPCRVFQRFPAVLPAHSCHAVGASLPFGSGRGRGWVERSSRRAGGLGGFWEVGRRIARQGGGIDPWQERWGRVPVSIRAGGEDFIGPTSSGNRRN